MLVAKSEILCYNTLMKKDLEQKIGLEVKENENLSKYTTFKIGGPAKFFIEVNNKSDLFKTLKAVHELKLPFFILGGGSNVLVSDKGFDGVVIHLTEGDIEYFGGGAKVFAGNDWRKFTRSVIEKGLSGLEFGANIPGTVGGAVYGNAGAYGQGAGDFVDRVEVIVGVGDFVDPSSVMVGAGDFVDPSSAMVGAEYHSAQKPKANNEITLKVLTKEECNFEYRESIFKKNKNWIISEVIFKLMPDEKSAEKLKQIDEEWNKRLCSQPLDLPSAGCSFKNILYTPELEKFKEWEIKGKLPVAKFIEDLDLKGYKIGGAMVSDKHANFILNFNNASADDVMQLISLVKSKVRTNFNIQLEEEVQYLGFN